MWSNKSLYRAGLGIGIDGVGVIDGVDGTALTDGTGMGADTGMDDDIGMLTLSKGFIWLLVEGHGEYPTPGDTERGEHPTPGDLGAPRIADVWLA
mmetsp:Transcript_95753/g.169987  ORF Transcript_95753/g.169987 Transcript_95753/m.169987 type:complete len:95 (-) Transcript_95753:124-408(-)